jgi:two-component system, NarL family, invasion response regulator UvrY
VIRVLIIDDHAIVRRGVRELLSDGLPSLEVGEAGDSREALQRLQESRWDLVLLDINLPGRGGLEVLQDARRIRPESPVLVLSAYAEEDFAVRAFKLGAAGYLCKTGASDELLTAANTVVAGGRYVTAALAERLAAVVGGDLRRASLHESLSGRELQVLRLIASGKTLKEIASELALSEKTVGTYRTRISEKMGLTSNVDLTRYAVKHGLVD